MWIITALTVIRNGGDVQRARPKILQLYLFSPLARHPSLSPFVFVTREGGSARCERRCRELDRWTSAYAASSPSVRPSLPGMFLLSSPSRPFASLLSLSPSTSTGNKALLSSVPLQTGWAWGGERDLQGVPPDSPSLAFGRSILGQALAVGSTSFPPESVVLQTPLPSPSARLGGTQHDLACFPFLSFYFSLFFLFVCLLLFEYADRSGLHLWGHKLLT